MVTITVENRLKIDECCDIIYPAISFSATRSCFLADYCIHQLLNVDFLLCAGKKHRPIHFSYLFIAT